VILWCSIWACTCFLFCLPDSQIRSAVGEGNLTKKVILPRPLSDGKEALGIHRSWDLSNSSLGKLFQLFHILPCLNLVNLFPLEIDQETPWWLVLGHNRRKRLQLDCRVSLLLTFRLVVIKSRRLPSTMAWPCWLLWSLRAAKSRSLSFCCTGRYWGLNYHGKQLQVK